MNFRIISALALVVCLWAAPTQAYAQRDDTRSGDPTATLDATIDAMRANITALETQVAALEAETAQLRRATRRTAGRTR